MNPEQFRSHKTQQFAKLAEPIAKSKLEKELLFRLENVIDMLPSSGDFSEVAKVIAEYGADAPHGEMDVEVLSNILNEYIPNQEDLA